MHEFFFFFFEVVSGPVFNWSHHYLVLLPGGVVYPGMGVCSFFTSFDSLGP